MADDASRAGRRGFLGATALGAILAGARSTLAQTRGGPAPAATAGASDGPVIMRRIGPTGQTVTALGLGTP
jgi:hypothetical protein